MYPLEQSFCSSNRHLHFPNDKLLSLLILEEEMKKEIIRVQQYYLHVS